MIELTDKSPQAAAQKIAAEANARIVELCRRAYQKGVNEGYAMGFKAGVDAASASQIAPSEVLCTKPV